jgi:uncharacterized protein
MLPNEPRALCVSIHDVAPATWPECLLLWNAMREVLADLPLTWLVVPRYHERDEANGETDAARADRFDKGLHKARPDIGGARAGAAAVEGGARVESGAVGPAGARAAFDPVSSAAINAENGIGIDVPCSGWSASNTGANAGLLATVNTRGHAGATAHDNAGLAMDRTLTQLIGAGHEVALHGLTHLDNADPPRGPLSHFVRRIYTTGEGEFAATDHDEALRRIDLGLAWFAARGWRADGFVPPAWLASAGSRAAMRGRPFAYTTTLSHFIFLPSQRAVWSPSLMYTARNAAGRCLSPRVADAMAQALTRNPLIRLSLHPADARHPALLRHAQDLVARLLKVRQPMTKAQFAQCYRGPARVLRASEARAPPVPLVEDRFM